MSKGRLRPGLLPLAGEALRRLGARLPVGAWVAFSAASLLVGAGLFAAACGRSGAPSAQAPDGSPQARPSAVVAASASGGASPAGSGLAATYESRADDLWARAAEAPEGEADEVLRLAHGEGSVGILERLGRGAPPVVGARALAYVDDFLAAPWLATTAQSGKDDEARAALEALAELAARPRTAVDPEDAAELKEGCVTLLALARDGKAPRPRRVGAVRALRMLADRGCVKPEEIPADVDTVVPAHAP